VCAYLTKVSWIEKAGVGGETLSSLTKATQPEMTLSVDSEASDVGLDIV